MKLVFRPKFYLGDVRMIYLERLYKKSLRIGAGDELVREADTLVHFASWERGLAGREFDTSEGERIMASPDYPEELRDVNCPLSERSFVAECVKAAGGADLDWALYFRDAEATVKSLQEELELME